MPDEDDWMFAWAAQAHYRFGESSTYCKPLRREAPVTKSEQASFEQSMRFTGAGVLCKPPGIEQESRRGLPRLTVGEDEVWLGVPEGEEIT